uniref:Uncharacterized protein n=1 Tax=viral metagenome TaxID=1070528 RepID=A0A6M3LEN6_9ZZZZ
MKFTPQMGARLDLQSEAVKERARANIERWGGQTAHILMVCMAEELGEIAEAVLRISIDWEKTKEAYRDAEQEARDLGALCLQMAMLCQLADRLAGEKANE